MTVYRAIPRQSTEAGCGQPTLVATELSAMAGAMFENYVISEIIKGYANSGIDIRSRLTYYRDNNGKEIDLLIMENGKIYPVEIKMSADPGKNALKNFSVLSSLNEEIGEGAVLW